MPVTAGGPSWFLLVRGIAFGYANVPADGSPTLVVCQPPSGNKSHRDRVLAKS